MTLTDALSLIALGLSLPRSWAPAALALAALLVVCEVLAAINLGLEDA